MTETRITNATTGGQKGQKLARFDLVPVRPLTALAEHFGKGAGKYADRNWEKGVDWSLNYAALMRHITAWWGGADQDEEGNSHLDAVMWHACVLKEYATTHPELDDRPSPPMAAAATADILPFKRTPITEDHIRAARVDAQQSHDWSQINPPYVARNKCYGEKEA